MNQTEVGPQTQTTEATLALTPNRGATSAPWAVEGRSSISWPTPEPPAVPDVNPRLLSDADVRFFQQGTSTRTSCCRSRMMKPSTNKSFEQRRAGLRWQRPGQSRRRGSWSGEIAPPGFFAQTQPAAALGLVLPELGWGCRLESLKAGRRRLPWGESPSSNPLASCDRDCGEDPHLILEASHLSKKNKI